MLRFFFVIYTFIMLTACYGLCRSFGPEVWIPNSRHLKSGKIAQYCNQKRTLFSIWVLHACWISPLISLPTEFHWSKPEQGNKNAPKLECFQAREYLCTWASLWFFFTEEECYARCGRPSLTFERNIPDTEIFCRFSAERKRFPFSTEQVCCQKDCCTLIQYLFTNVKNTAASWLLLIL